MFAEQIFVFLQTKRSSSGHHHYFYKENKETNGKEFHTRPSIALRVMRVVNPKLRRGGALLSLRTVDYKHITLHKLEKYFIVFVRKKLFTTEPAYYV